MMQLIQRTAFSVFFFQISLIKGIEGLAIYPASDLTAQSFNLVCDLQGTPWTKPIIFSYDGNPAGGCSSPPNPTCVSMVGTIVTDNQTVNLTLNQNEILSKGTALWTCTHGSKSTSFNATVIAVCLRGKLNHRDGKININCSCGYPSVQAKIQYKDREGGNQLGDQTFNLKSSPGTICTSDARAMDFYYQIEHIPSGAMEVCATIKTFSQISTPETICISVAGIERYPIG